MSFGKNFSKKKIVTAVYHVDLLIMSKYVPLENFGEIYHDNHRFWPPWMYTLIRRLVASQWAYPFSV